MNFKLETNGERVLGRCPELASPRVTHLRAMAREAAAKRIIVTVESKNEVMWSTRPADVRPTSDVTLIDRDCLHYYKTVCQAKGVLIKKNVNKLTVVFWNDHTIRQTLLSQQAWSPTTEFPTRRLTSHESHKLVRKNVYSLSVSTKSACVSTSRSIECIVQ